MTLTSDQLDQITARYLELDARRTSLTEELDTIKSQLRTELGYGKHPTTNGCAVTISPNRRFDPDKAGQLIDPDTLPKVTRQVIDSHAVKRILAPALYEACCTEYDPKVSIT